MKSQLHPATVPSVSMLPSSAKVQVNPSAGHTQLKSAVGAEFGVGVPTVTVWLAVLVAPLSSVTVSLTVYTSAVE